MLSVSSRKFVYGYLFSGHIAINLVITYVRDRTCETMPLLPGYMLYISAQAQTNARYSQAIYTGRHISDPDS